MSHALPSDHLIDLDATAHMSRAELESRAKALRTILAITDALLAAESPAEVYERAIDTIARLTRFPAVGIFSVDEKANRVELLRARGFGDAVIEAVRYLPLDGSLTGLAVRTREIVTSARAGADARVEPVTGKLLAEEGFEAVASVPLVLGERVIGVLNLIYKGELGLSPYERDMLGSIANVIALGIERARYVQRIESEIVERRRAETELATFKFLVDRTGDECYLVRTDGSFAYVNEAAAASLGYSIPELLALDLDAISDEPLASLARSGPETTRVMHRTKAGEKRTKELSAARIQAGDGELWGLFARDVTERLRVDEQLRKAQRIEGLGVLAGGIAHDFNNLLAGILGNLSLARRVPPGELGALIEASEKATIRAKDLARQLLTFATGGAPMKQPTEHIAAIVSDAASFAVSGSSVRCELDLPADLCAVEVDAAQIAQVVQNLVLNAREAMPAGGVVVVRARNLDGRAIQLEVEDQGSGISPENVERVFDPFFTTKSGGTGLGLATAYSIITKHGGHISVRSVPGAGTTFTIELPVGRVDGPERAAVAAHPARGEGHVLVMDDEPNLRWLLAKLLEALGYSCTTTATGEEAVEAYRRALEEGHPFDAVILDRTVRGGTGGLEALEALRALDSEVVAVLSSGYSADAISADWARHGFRAALEKPYTIEQLGETLAAVAAARPR